MSEPSSAPAIRRIEQKNPMRYDYDARAQGDISGTDILDAQRLRYPEVKLHTATPYDATLLTALLPIIKSEKNPQTLEFINLTDWHKRANDHRILRGAILRDEQQDILLYVYGVRVNDKLAAASYGVLCEMFNITPQETQALKEMTRPSYDYSLILHLV
ncbi:MAG: hypothetical protein ACREGE_04465 [Candidatus Microsaccharimonas sp.]